MVILDLTDTLDFCMQKLEIWSSHSSRTFLCTIDMNNLYLLTSKGEIHKTDDIKQASE